MNLDVLRAFSCSLPLQAYTGFCGYCGKPRSPRVSRFTAPRALWKLSRRRPLSAHGLGQPDAITAPDPLAPPLVTRPVRLVDRRASVLPGRPVAVRWPYPPRTPAGDSAAGPAAVRARHLARGWGPTRPPAHAGLSPPARPGGRGDREIDFPHYQQEKWCMRDSRFRVLHVFNNCGSCCGKRWSFPCKTTGFT